MRGTLRHLSELLKAPGTRDTRLVFFSMAGNSALGFVINLLLLRALSPDDYGRFSLFLSAMMLLAGFIHLGWMDTYVVFGSRASGAGGTEAQAAVTRFFLSRTLASSLAIAALACVAAPWIASHVHQRPEFAPFLVAAFCGAFISNLFSFRMTRLRVRQAFGAFALSQLGSALLRGVLVAALIAMGWAALGPVVAVYLVVPALFCVSILKDWRAGRGLGIDPGMRSEIHAFNGWLVLSLVTTSFIGNIDPQILAHYHGDAVLAELGVVGRLSLPIHLLISAMTTTLLPKLSAARSEPEIRAYLDRLKALLPATAALGALLCWFGAPLLIRLAGEPYAGLVPLLRIQLLTVMVALVCSPIGLLLYSFGAAKWLALMNVAQLALDVMLDLSWIPAHGARGAVLATLAVNVFGLVFVSAAVARKLRDLRGSKTPTPAEPSP